MLHSTLFSSALVQNREHSVGIAANRTAKVLFLNMGSYFLLFITSRQVLRPTQPPIQWVKKNLSPRVKRQRREIDHSPPSTARVKKVGAIPPLHHTSTWFTA
jgi:hypothetical protein